jgi:hypothetical protein
MSYGKRKRKINFSVRERIVPGSVMGIIPFISDAVAHLVALYDTEELVFFNNEPFDLDEIFSNNKLNNSLLEVHTIDLSFATLPQYIDNHANNTDLVDTMSRINGLRNLDIPLINSTIPKEVSNTPSESIESILQQETYKEDKQTFYPPFSKACLMKLLTVES